MKNFLAPVMSNKVVNKVVSEVGKFYGEHQSSIHTTGIIGLSMATTAVTFRNADAIKETLADAKYALSTCNTDEERNKVYKLTLTTLAPLVAPIVIFQGATIGLAIYSQKVSDKKLAAATSALTVAHEVITQYQAFQKQAEESLGEKEYEKIQKKIFKEQEVDGRRFTAVASEGAPGEVLIIDKYSGRPFWSTTERVENAAREYSRRLTPSGGYDQQSINDLYDLIGNTDLTPNELGERFGHIADVDFGSDYISAHFADTHYVFPNGTRIPAFEMYLYPEPGCIDWGC